MNFLIIQEALRAVEKLAPRQTQDNWQELTEEALELVKEKIGTVRADERYLRDLLGSILRDDDLTLIETQSRYLRMKARKDGAYLERNQCVALIARMAVQLGYQCVVTKTAIEGWSEDWHGCIYIYLPTGQVSWHFHDSQAYIFAEFPTGTCEYDGHTTGMKYERVAAAFRL